MKEYDKYTTHTDQSTEELGRYLDTRVIMRVMISGGAVHPNPEPSNHKPQTSNP